MRSTGYLKKRNGNFYFRLRIPSDLSSHFPQTEIVKSLKTSDLKTAKDSSLQYLQGIYQTFSLLRSSFINQEQALERFYGLFGCKCGGGSRNAYEARQKLSMVVKIFVADKEKEWTAKTKMETEGVFKLTLDLLGDIPVTSIDRNMVREFRDKLQKLPPNVYKVYSKQTPNEVLKLIDSGKLTASPMSITSVNKHLSRLYTLMVFSIKEGYRSDNPVTEMTIKQKKRSDEERKAYNSQDIQNIFVSLPREKDKPERLNRL